MIPKRLLAAATGIASLIIFCLPTDSQITAYMLFGVILGASWAMKGIEECLQGVIGGAIIGALASIVNESLASQAVDASPSMVLLVAVLRILLPATAYFVLGSVPSMRS